MEANFNHDTIVNSRVNWKTKIDRRILEVIHYVSEIRETHVRALRWKN